MQEIKLPNKPIYLHPPARVVMIFFFYYSCKRGIRKSSYLFSEREEKNNNWALISAPSAQQHLDAGWKSHSVHAVQEEHITHRHAIWTTNDSHRHGHQSGCYCSSVLINLDQASWILCRQSRSSKKKKKKKPLTTHTRGPDPRDS